MSGLQETQSAGANVILHAFDWKYADIAQRANEIHQLGYGSVLVSPPMKSAHDERWWQRYQPQDYRVIDNALGDTQDFIYMVRELERVGVWYTPMWCLTTWLTKHIYAVICNILVRTC